MHLLIENCALLTPDASQGYETGRYIAIKGNTIEAITDRRPDGDFDQVLSGHNRLAIPGLINAHTHSPENFMRGTAEQLPLEPWLVHVIATSGAYSPRDHYLSAMVGAIEMIRTGVTAVLDHFWSTTDIPEILSAAMQAYKDSGLRAAIAPLYRDAQLDVDSGIERGHPLDETFYGGQYSNFFLPWPDRLQLLETFFERWHGAAGGRLRCMVGPSGVQWSTEMLLQESLALARRYHSGFHMHLLETRVQDWSCRQHFGSSAVQWLAERELLGPEMSLSHAVWLTDTDLEFIAKAGAGIVHNPVANLKLGSGLAPVPAMLSLGVPVALGTDGAASNDNQVLFEAIRLAALLHNSPETDPRLWISARQALQMVTEGGAYVLGLEGRLGKIEPGYLADITLLDLSSPHLFPMNEAYRQLVYCDVGRSVRTVIVDGMVLMNEGRIEVFNEQAILAEAREAVTERLYRHPKLPQEVQADIEKFINFSRDIILNT